ncbi:hypothetical protein Dsin_011514 [Dipteronia sinensis]|uniref:RNase H type-1 domain-containing protein n=1 Tax=Dipteronia sinensis TaxID=43782 RepID=A0AAE0AVT2_9ROSI|nr:hypothetical protein Dsin_011514 [Dipteronia sinensis]
MMMADAVAEPQKEEDGGPVMDGGLVETWSGRRAQSRQGYVCDPRTSVLSQCLQVVVGCGDIESFWNDVRVDSTSLKIAFPRIFVLTTNKAGCVRDFGKRVDSKWKWEVQLRRPLFDWEIEQWKCFKVCLGCIQIRDMISDTIVWSHCPHGQFSVGSFRRWTWKLWSICMDWWNVKSCSSPSLRDWWSDDISMMILNIKQSCTDSMPLKTSKIENWIPPLLDSLKSNEDVSARGSPGRAGIGGVLRDSKGKILCTFSDHIGIQDANTAEILAIARVCELCVSKPELVGRDITIASEILAIARVCELCVSKPELVGRDITIASDSKTAVYWVNNEGIGSLKHVQIIYDIRCNVRVMGRSLVIYNSRASNSVVDQLAKNGSGGSEDSLVWGVH